MECNLSYFENKYSLLRFPIKSNDVTKGFRNAQIGAIYSIGSYYTLHKEKPAIISMPTGSGKTLVIMITPYLLRVKRVLIITPSVMVRGQICERFKDTNYFEKINCFANLKSPPNIKQIKKSISSDENIEELKAHDVVVSTPNCIYPMLAINPDKDIFDLIIFDEGHHSAAKTWSSIINYFDSAKKIIFTATPYRRDKKEIEGDIIYNYPLAKAYQDKIFGEVEFHPIKASNNNDIQLAKSAERIFNKDKALGLEHCIFVRTNSMKHAKELDEIYKINTNLKLSKIDSSNTVTYAKSIIKKMSNKELDGIICVNMLGEGFDFPNLKIAVIHKPHKTLATTLQFIGRFARTNADNIGTAKFIAIENDELAIENRKLYSNDAIWMSMIIDLSEKKIYLEEELKTYLKDFTYIRGSDEYDEMKFDQSILYNLNPFFHVKIFKVDDFIINDNWKITNQETVKFFESDDGCTVVLITVEKSKPRWVTDKIIEDHKHHLYIVYFNKKHKTVFINSQVKTISAYEEIISQFCTEYTPIPKYQIHKVLTDLNKIEIFNVGLQNRYETSGESYRIMAGSNTEKMLDQNTGKIHVNGHVFCKAIKANSDKVTVGYSSASKIWSNRYDKLIEFNVWCDNIADKIHSTKTVMTNTNFDKIPIGEPFDKIPEGIYACTFHHKTFIETPSIMVYSAEESILDINLTIKNSSDTDISITIHLDPFEFVIRYNIDTKFYYTNQNDNSKITVNEDGNYIDIIEYLNNFPLTFYSVSNSSIIDNELYKAPEFENYKFDKNKIATIDWDLIGTDILSEYEGDNSIHIAIRKNLLSKTNYNCIIYDHGTGELADFITITRNKADISVEFYHIKAAGGKSFNSRVNDLYEVCGQCVKSLIWTKNKSYFYQNIKRRILLDVDKKILKGTISEIGDIFECLLPVRFKIIAIQPGISISKDLPDKLSEVLNSANGHLINSGIPTGLLVWGSN